MTNLAENLAPELPYVRRFARALTGSQERGDAYVVATLETLIADHQSLSGKLPLRPGLYQTFLKVWNTLPLNHKADPVEREKVRSSIAASRLSRRRHGRRSCSRPSKNFRMPRLPRS